MLSFVHGVSLVAGDKRMQNSWELPQVGAELSLSIVQVSQHPARLEGREGEMLEQLGIVLLSAFS